MEKLIISKPFPPFSNASIEEFMKNIKNNRNFHINVSEIDKNLLDVTFTFREDYLYIENDLHKLNIRSGMTVYKFKDSYKIVRKGLQKFFCFKYYDIDPEIIKSANFLSERNKKKKGNPE